MKWYRNLKIAPKLIIGFMAITVVAGADGAVITLLSQHFSGMAVILSFGGLSLVGLLIAFFAGRAVARLISKPINLMVETAEKIADGNMNASCDIIAKGEIGQLDESLHKMVVSFRAMVDDLKMLLAAAGDGNLSERADVSRHNGDFKAVVEGFNGMLDIFSAPLGEFKAAVQRLTVNDFTRDVTGHYHGIFAEMTEYCNQAMHQMQGVAAAFGDTAVGDFAKLPNYEKLGRRSENDHLLPSAVKMMQSINALIDESNTLSEAVKEGNLKFRCDEAKFEGRYREAIVGMNSIMDAISQPMDDLMAVLGAMSHQDLSNEMNGKYNGAFEEMAQTINSMLYTLNQVLSGINAAAEQVASGTQQVSSGSQALSQGATEQASATEQLTASLAEIANQTRQNAVNASQASDLAASAKNDAAAGDVRMKELQQAMGEINEASASISKIIKVIDDIAFQTNLLALNAAVEAARAGQHGRGFAVVAEEVRNLAQRSAGAAKETTVMIEESIKKIKSGTKIANETASALNRIVDSVDKAAGLVVGIAKASGDQASSVAQVNSGIEQVSQVTQTNSATAEQSAAASEELSSQADLLKNMVGKFTLRSGAQAAGRKPAPAADRRVKLESARAQQIAAKPRIALNDGEFGKY